MFRKSTVLHQNRSINKSFLFLFQEECWIKQHRTRKSGLNLKLKNRRRNWNLKQKIISPVGFSIQSKVGHTITTFIQKLICFQNIILTKNMKTNLKVSPSILWRLRNKRKTKLNQKFPGPSIFLWSLRNKKLKNNFKIPLKSSTNLKLKSNN